jgi:hypothetical protein
MKRFLLASFAIWALCLSGATCTSRTTQGPQNLRSQNNQPAQRAPKENQPMAPSVTLTQAHVSDSLPIDLKAIPKDAQAIQVTVTNVKNPAATQVSVYVYFSTANQTRKGQQKLIGSFSLYPADRGGNFILNASEAARLLQANDAAAKNARLVFELRRIHEERPWTPVEMTIEQPRWESEKG